MTETLPEIVIEDREVYYPHDPSRASVVKGYKNTKPIQLLSDILEPLTSLEKDYICFRLLGLPRIRAKIIADELHEVQHEEWPDSGKLKEIEDRVIYMHSLYAQQALTLLDINTKALAMAIIQQVLLRATNWRTARIEDKKMAASVLKLALDYKAPVVKEPEPKAKAKEDKSSHEKGSYEKLILERKISE